MLIKLSLYSIYKSSSIEARSVCHAGLHSSSLACYLHIELDLYASFHSPLFIWPSLPVRS